MITLQEISDFVNQPTLRKIPRDVWSAVTKDTRINYVYFFGINLLLIVLVFLWLLFIGKLPGHILLDIANKKTEHGTIIGWERAGQESAHSERKRYRVTFRFSIPTVDVTANCYVDGIKNIPGWGQIPESLNEQASSVFVRLKEPFPVVVEYAPWHPSLARVVGTRFSSFGYGAWLCFSAVFLIFAQLGGWGFCLSLRERKITKRPLSEGRFATGRVLEIRVKGEPIPPKSFDGIVLFRDQYGAEQADSFHVQYSATKWRRWAEEDRSVGLLYLPDLEKVLITDLWL